MSIIFNDLRMHIRLTITMIIGVVDIHGMFLHFFSSIYNIEGIISHGNVFMSERHAKKNS
jgi:hypothetical protein